jgi:hypothetical protein
VLFANNKLKEIIKKMDLKYIYMNGVMINIKFKNNKIMLKNYNHNNNSNNNNNQKKKRN